MTDKQEIRPYRNEVHLAGRVHKPVLSFAQGDPARPWARFSVVVPKTFTTAAGEVRQAKHYVPVLLFGGDAEIVGRMNDGDWVEVTGVVESKYGRGRNSSGPKTRQAYIVPSQPLSWIPRAQYDAAALDPPMPETEDGPATRARAADDEFSDVPY